MRFIRLGILFFCLPAFGDVNFIPESHDYVIIQDGVEQTEVLTQAEAEALSTTLKNGCASCEVKYITPGNYQVTVFVNPPPPPSGESTGLDFPGSAAVSSTMRFQFSNPLPIYPATYIWKVYPRRQAGYYTTFFWGNDDGQGNLNTWTSDHGQHYGFHPYPQPAPNGSDHKWEISLGQDWLGKDVAYDRWYTQAAVVWQDATDRQHLFYTELDTDPTVVLSASQPNYSIDGSAPYPHLIFGDAPWSPGNEVMNGIIRGIQIYTGTLSLADIQAEAANPLSTVAGMNNVWYLNTNPTPTDISDKSGRGHNPAWVGSERPLLWSGNVEPPPPPPPPPTGVIYALAETNFTGNHVVAGTFSVPGQSLAIDFEITPRSYPTVDTRIISKSVGQQAQDHVFMVSMYNGKLRYRLKTNGSTSTLFGNARIRLNTKTVGQVTYDGSQMRIFVNGVLDASLSKSGDMPTSTAEVWVGANPPDGYSPFYGTIAVTVK